MDVEQKPAKTLAIIESRGVTTIGYAVAAFLYLFVDSNSLRWACADGDAGRQSVIEAVEPNLVPKSMPIQSANASSKYVNKYSLQQQSIEADEPDRITALNHSPALKQVPSTTLAEISQDKKAVPNISPSKKESTNKSPQNYLPVQRPIGQISIDVRPKPKGTSNTVPENLALQSVGDSPMVFAARADEMITDPMMQTALSRSHVFGYQPLYFEEVNLERYGRSYGHFQPALSGLRFFATVPSLPYAMTVHSPNKTYTWRWPYEAGWGAPKVRELEPLQWKPGMVQAAAVTGLIFVVP